MPASIGRANRLLVNDWKGVGTVTPGDVTVTDLGFAVSFPGAASCFGPAVVGGEDRRGGAATALRIGDVVAVVAAGRGAITVSTGVAAAVVAGAVLGSAVVGGGAVVVVEGGVGWRVRIVWAAVAL
jgi:hypothetical protein